MPVTVPKTAFSVVLWRNALDNHKAHNAKLTSWEQTLVYPDFKEGNNIPGTNDFFTVEKYKESLGKHIPILIYCHAEQKILKVGIMQFQKLVHVQY